MFKKKPEGILYCNKSKLTLVIPKGEVQISLDLSSDFFQHLDITNVDKLKVKVAELCEETKISSVNLIMILSEDFLFSKKFPSQDSDLNKNIQAFLEEIPFELLNITKKRFVIKDETLVVATNKTFFQEVIAAFAEADWRILFVVPDTVFNIVTVNIDTATAILKELKTVKESSFIEEASVETEGEEVHSIAPEDKKAVSKKSDEKKEKNVTKVKKEGEEQPKKSPFRTVIVIAVILLNVVNVFVVVRYLSHVGDVASESDPPVVEVVPPPVEKVSESTKSEEPEVEYTISEATVQVLNGTGVAGLAGDTKELITDLGFVSDNIEIGNAPTGGATETTVQVSGDVPEELVEELVQLLGEVFVEVTSDMVEDIEGFDFVIVTGALN